MVVGKPALRQMEQDLWQALHEEQRPNPHFRDLSQARLEAMAPVELNEAQRRAFVGALSSNLLLLSGGAGSGTIPELARLVGISRFRMSRLIKASGVQVTRNGRSVLVFLSALQRGLPALVESLSQQAIPPGA